MYAEIFVDLDRPDTSGPDVEAAQSRYDERVYVSATWLVAGKTRLCIAMTPLQALATANQLRAAAMTALGQEEAPAQTAGAHTWPGGTSMSAASDAPACLGALPTTPRSREPT